jgi:penicillin-binding protein 2
MTAHVYKKLVLFLLILMISCSPVAANGSSSTNATATNGLLEVVPEVTPAPNVEAAVSAYLDAWRQFNYPAMYSMLTELSQDAISLEDFTARYEHVYREANLFQIDYEILSTLTNPNTAQASYRITLYSAIVGPISRDTTIDLSRDGSNWRVIWDDRIILPELVGGNTLSMERYVPVRGDIYDQFGDAIAVNGDAMAVAVVPSLIEDEDNIGGLAAQLAVLTGGNANIITEQITSEDAPYLLPIGVVPLDVWNQRKEFVTAYGVVSYEQYYNTRLYLRGGAGPQTVGYVGPIPVEELDDWTARGYTSGDRIGRIGIEAWGEEYLSGTRGGALYVISPQGQIVTQLAAADSQPADSIYTTLDRELQLQAQEAIKDFVGAIVVLERDTGRILAMVSSPDFDPNAADFNNPISNWNEVVSDPANPLFNRATQGQYPPGSIFKTITLSAALESGIYSPESSLFCGHTWQNWDGPPLDDWTLEKDLPASGELTLLEGLMRSCNPWFYEIGLTLYNWQEKDFTTIVADIARGYGLGVLTAIDILPEESGQITNPDDEEFPLSAAVQQAIGQGTTLITPLQAAVYIAALGNGGELYKPQLIESIRNPNGEIKFTFEPVINGTLPINEQTLLDIQRGLRMVIDNPRGTAYRRFVNINIPIAGKTGTAQNPFGDAHAWFIGYTYGERQDRPDIAITVLIENIGDGSEFAAPIFKRLVEVYFYGAPQTIYPWETKIGILNPAYFEEETEEEGEESPPDEEEDGPVELTPQ